MDSKKINQLSRAFSVQDIMTHVKDLKRASSYSGATRLFRQYDIVPFPARGLVEGFYESNFVEKQPIEREKILSDGTSLFDLPGLFLKSDFYFVISAAEVAGYVHYSDLNKPVVKIPLFAMYQAYERMLWDKISHRVTEDVVKMLFQDKAESLIRAKRNAERGNIDLYWVGVFTFPYIAKIGRHFGVSHLEDEQIKHLKDLRNSVAHSDHNLVRDKQDVKRLASTYSLLRSLVP